MAAGPTADNVTTRNPHWLDIYGRSGSTFTVAKALGWPYETPYPDEKARCPLHGDTVIAFCNMAEPVLNGRGDWTPRDA